MGEFVQAEHQNAVELVGRLAAPPEERVLPSGDVVAQFRLVVERGSESRGPGGQTVDTVDCAAWRGDVRRQARSWGAGETIYVSGALRRRFWRAAGGPASRYEVEVRRARRVQKTAS